MKQIFESLIEDTRRHESDLQILVEDYDRMLGDVDVRISIDTSELFNFLNPRALGSRRAAVTAHILETLDTTFTLVPLTVAELLRTLKRQVVPERMIDILGRFPEVDSFMRFYPKIRNNPGRLLRLYAPVEERAIEVCGLLYEDVFLDESMGEHRDRATAFLRILKEKVEPLGDLDSVPEQLTSKLVGEHNWLRRELDNFRRMKTRNNEIDALNYVMLLHYNQTVGKAHDLHTVLYTGPGVLANACSRKPTLSSGNSFLIRSPDVLRMRTQIEVRTPRPEEAQRQAKDWLTLCRDLRAETTKCMRRGCKPSGRQLELSERYYQDLKESLGFRPRGEELNGLRRRAEKVYAAIERGKVPKIDSTVLEEVTKIDFVKRCESEIRRYLDAVPAKGKTAVERVRRWLGLGPTKKGSAP